MTEKFRYIVVEDDEIDRLAIKAEADRFPFLQGMAACGHPLEAIELIARFRPDILFLDIEMPGMSGLELIRRLSGEVPIPVFITSHPEFAIEGYELDAFDYLLKPLTAERFDRCAGRLQDFLTLRSKAYAFDKYNQADSLVIKQGHEKYKLNIPDIVYLEAMKDYTRIVTLSGQYLVLCTLSHMISQLPVEKFVRIHRSYVVNLDKIGALKGGKVYLPTHELPVGKLYKKAIHDLL